MLDAVLGVGGAILDKLFGDDSAEKQAELQREFAQNGIRWKVEDAKAAGIHPLYALGASTAQYAPITVGTDFASQGQNLGRAISAMRTPAEKEGAFQKTVEALTLDKMGLENEILRSQLRNINSPGTGPGMPGTNVIIDGQGNSGPTISIDGQKLTLNTDTSAGDVENELGEIPGEIAGITRAIDAIMKRDKMPMPHEVPRRLSDALLEYLKKNPGGSSSDHQGSFY